MKRSALVLALVFGAALVSVRAQDDDDNKEKKKEKPTYHVTIWAQGVNDPIDIDDVVKWTQTEKGFTTKSVGGGESWVATDKIIAWVAEPKAAHKKAQEEKAPK